MRPATFALVLALALAAPLVSSSAAAGRVVIPLVCSRGPSGHHFEVSVAAPTAVTPGTVFAVRIDGASSGTISHTGLRYVHDIAYEYPIPAGSSYVEGSAHLIADTGTPNVRSGARIAYDHGALTLMLPGRVDDGSSYTPPSFEFQLQATASPGGTIAHSFASYRITANAFLIGDLKTSCDPTPKPYPVAITHVETPAPP
jgi:hypothetical protein